MALFCTAELKPMYLALGLAPPAAMGWLNARVAPVLLLGLVLWVLVLKSGVQATLAGVITAFFIVPVFAFANAGVSLSGLSPEATTSPLTLGIVAGLVLGKRIGVFGATWLMVRSGLARLPRGVSWLQIYGLSTLAEIGFTMSLFIGGLSFTVPALMNKVRLGGHRLHGAQDLDRDRDGGGT